MAVTISSTTDSPEEVTRALEAAGQTVESVETISNEPEKKVETPPKTEVKDKSAPAEHPSPEGDGKPGEGKTADDSETPEETEETEEQVEVKKGRGAAKKIDSLTKEKATLAQEKAERDGQIKELKSQIDELRSILPKPGDEPKKPAEEKVVEPEKPVEAKPKPKLEDFESHEDWLDALTDWKIEQKPAKPNDEVKKLTEELAKLKTELADKEQKNAALSEGEQRMAAFHDRNSEVIKGYEKWDEVSKSPDTVAISEAMQDLILDLDGGADVVYYLATHPDEAKKVLAVTSIGKDTKPREATRAIQMAGIEYSRIHSLAVAERTAKTEAQIAEDAGEAPAAEPAKPATTPKPKPAVSKAPPPIKPNKGAAAPSAETPYEKPEGMPHKEYLEWHRRTFPNKYPRSA